MNWIKSMAAMMGMPSDDTDLLVPKINYIEHLAKFGYSYATTEEFEFRLNEYMKADQLITEFNADPLNTFTVAHNHFSTWTKQEYLNILKFKSSTEQSEVVHLDVSDLPDEVDWVQKGAVTDIQNQGNCGSCWTFASAAAMEGSHFIKTGNLIKLSEQ